MAFDQIWIYITFKRYTQILRKLFYYFDQNIPKRCGLYWFQPWDVLFDLSDRQLVDILGVEVRDINIRPPNLFVRLADLGQMISDHLGLILITKAAYFLHLNSFLFPLVIFSDPLELRAIGNFWQLFGHQSCLSCTFSLSLKTFSHVWNPDGSIVI